MPNFDIVVYGATPSGILAATAASNEGASVRLIEPSDHVGGMVTGGLSRTDVLDRELVGGLAREYFETVADRTPDENEFGDPKPWDVEPHVAMAVFEEWIDDADYSLVTETRLDTVGIDDGQIESVVLETGDEYEGTVFVDATYEGDLMASADVSYTVGRESRDTYDEPAAGFHQQPTVKYDPVDYREPEERGGDSDVKYLHDSQFGARISARDEDGELLPGVNPGPKPEPGTGDDGVQAYGFRLPVTKREDLRVPWPKPDTYDPDRYELLLRYIDAHPEISFEKLVHLGAIPNEKADLNSCGPFSTDYVGGSWEYPEGDYETRERIRQAHEDYDKGFFWFLANDERVPEKVRREANEWGLCRDEFVDNGHWPPQLYVREGRRMLGRYVMTQHDVTEQVAKHDSVGMGSFIVDSHTVQYIEAEDGAVEEEGHLSLSPSFYEIPYRSITPQASECTNLLVPVCVSASHVGVCTIRMEPVYMVLGHSAGVAAAMACESETPVQEVGDKALQHRLVQQDQVIRHKNKR